MTGEEKLAPVPAYDDLVERNQIQLLQKPGDLVARNGDIAVTRWGDLMLNDEDYSAFFKLVQTWRFNFPTLKVLFDASIDSAQRGTSLEADLDDLFAQAAAKSPHPMHGLDYDAYHRANDSMGAAAIARGVYAGSITIVLSNMLQSFRANIAGTQEEWKKAAPLFNGCSIGQIIEASANNVRHADEWQTTRPPTRQQMNSILVLSTALCEPLVPPDGSRHRFSREISPEALQLISGGDFSKLETNLFLFANNMLKQRQIRLPSQIPHTR
jgi:hypothetical protein